MKPRWRIYFCCNCPDNGEFWERCDFVEISCGDHNLRLDGPSRTFRWLSGNRFRFSRRTFQHHGMREWAGNWCWDECVVTRKTARQFLYLLAELRFRPEVGSQLMWDWYERQQKNIQG